MSATVYLETSVVSYYTARPSRDLVVAARQAVTREWWDDRLPRYEVYVSELVLDEASGGDASAARLRTKAIAPFTVLALTPESQAIAGDLVAAGLVPAEYLEDALHLAVAAVGGIDYLVTWNCRHLANAEVQRGFRALLVARGYEPPIICTPQELMGDSE